MKVHNNKILALLMLFVFSPVLGIKVAITIKLWMILLLFFIFIRLDDIKISNFSVYSVPIYFLIFGLSSLIFNIASANSDSVFFSIIPLILFILCLVLDQFDFSDFKEAFLIFLKVYLILTILYGGVGFIHVNSSTVENNQNYYGVFIQHLAPRLSGLVGDPNILAFYFSIIFCVAYSLRYNFKLLLSLLVVIFLTGSRTALVFIAIAVVVLLAKNIRYLPLAFILLSLLIYNSIDFSSSEFNLSVLLRINEDVDLSRVGGRMDIWKPVFHYITDNPLYIGGFGSGRSFSQSVIGTPTYFHNSYLEIAYELGIFSLVLYILIVSFIIFSSKLCAIEKFLFFCAFAIFALSLSIHLSEVLFFAIVFILKFKRKIKMLC
ncbi:TPA: O-antigen ligase family protein [Vibrio vulnificus]|uniref:O-antigen ligase family protein n=1 Tax=Vibrio vulnificus TaxID=672 RepID=UPI0009B6FA4D|nr:O-antigen ligase family protein [Vibrio vulnificus]OQK47720.1 putative membrane protein [Vibrio vulnificus]POC25997.1 hypothetical protein CRN46_05220 [Vibrio vulnificus]HDY7433881.1 O-antigen ligase family protein [Vibrio vulnificus]HDY7731341.1 O-antigen ligase family protein [Vibrio vulnificus]HDY7863586.1 O-antigen ligase family protein [Vibrio vulnificus]